MTVNSFTSVDTHPFPNMEELLNNTSENLFFSKIDLKRAYHQVPMKQEDNQFTAFVVKRKLYEFIRLLFFVTNAEPAFQRNIDHFVHQNKLEKT